MRDVTFIADLGSNWDSEQDIIDAIPAVKAAGADVFKLQFFSKRSLYGLPMTEEKPRFDLEKIAIACQVAQIELMASVFNEKDVVFVVRYLFRE